MGPGESSGICRVTDMSDRILYARWFDRGNGGQAQPPRNGKVRREPDRHKAGLSGPDSMAEPNLPGNGGGRERQNPQRQSHKRDQGNPQRLILQCLEGINSALA
jgi:hypothetical protein